MGAAWHNPDTGLSMGYRVWGSASSTNPEAKAALLMLEISPPDTTIHIHTDSQSTHNMLQKIADGSYKDLTVRNIMKRNCWMTWERINTIVKSKNINLHTHKVLAHSGNQYNDTADLVAKEAARNIPDLETHNSENCRFSFTLKHRDLIIEENPRRYLRHLTQNVRRGEWSKHQTAQKLATIHTTSPIDWSALKEIIHQDGNMMSGFSSRKTSQARSYITKSVTGTLPTMKTLHDKWTLYDTTTCPRCFNDTETNQHVWDCPKSEPALKAITDQLHTRFELPSSMRPSVKLLAQGIPTMALTQFLRKKTKNHLSLSADGTPTAKDVAKEMTKTMLSIVHSAYSDIWKERCKASIIYQQAILNIQSNQKKNPQNEQRRPPPAEEVEDSPHGWQARTTHPPTHTEEEPMVRVSSSDLDKKLDAYRCECGKHSLTHFPGRSCDLAGLIQNRAQDILSSSRNRLIDTIPFFLENKVLSWTAPRQ